MATAGPGVALEVSIIFFFLIETSYLPLPQSEGKLALHLQNSILLFIEHTYISSVHSSSLILKIIK